MFLWAHVQLRKQQDHSICDMPGIQVWLLKARECLKLELCSYYVLKSNDHQSTGAFSVEKVTVIIE